MTNGTTAHVRAYFTRFDRATFANAGWYDEDLEAYETELVRELKLLALLKGRVVIAVSHLLESEIARSLVINHPELLSNGIVVPALRDDCSTASEFLDMKLDSEECALYGEPEVRIVQQALDQLAVESSRWNPQRTMSWLHRRLCKDLEQPYSVLRVELAKTLSEGSVLSLHDRLLEFERVSRSTILAAARETFGSPHPRFTEYLDFLYYLSGAIAVDAEGVLPQENLVVYDVAAQDDSRDRLSEMELFYRVVMSIIREHTQRALPIEAIDALSFSDIADLRATSLHHDFVAKYHETVKQAKERTTIADATQLVLRVEELESMELELCRTFGDTIAKEVRERSKEQAERQLLRFLGSVTAVLPLYESASTVVDITSSGLGLVVPAETRKRLAEKYKGVWSSLEAVVDRRGFQDRNVLLKFLGKIADRYRSGILEA